MDYVGTDAILPGLKIRNEAARITGVGKTQLSECLNGKMETAGGLHWRRDRESN